MSAAVQIFAGPGGTQPLAFNTEEGDFIEGIDHPQPRVEFQAVDDAHWIAEANMFGAQVAVPIDNVPRPHALGQKLGPLDQKAALHGVDVANGSGGNAESAGREERGDCRRGCAITPQRIRRAK